MTNAKNPIICVPISQHFAELSISARGLYVTFMSEPSAINRAHDYYQEFTPQVVTQVIQALVADGIFRAEKDSRPVRYELVPQTKPKDDLIDRLFAIYLEVRDPSWVNHRIVNRTLRKALKGFVAQVGEDAAEDVMRRGLSAQKKWAAGKNVDFLNLLTNDKVIRFAEQTQNQNSASMSGRVYRLNTSAPDPSLPQRASYAIRIDEQADGVVIGYVFPEGEIEHGINTSVSISNLSAPIGDWTRYAQQHA